MIQDIPVLPVREEIHLVKASEIKNVLILGAGTMGRQIGCLCAIHGYRVMLYDTSVEILDSARAGISKLLSRFQEKGVITTAQAEDAIGMIFCSTDPLEAAGEADIISESLPEDPALKAKVFSQFNSLCPERAVFTTNTSTLIPSMIARETGRPDRFIALHFHNVSTTNVVDVMPHPNTSPEVIELVEQFARSLGQIVISLKRENHGYVFNAMLSSLFSSALALASNGVATVEDIDRAWMGVMHTPIGPFGIMDRVGLTTVYTITNYWAKKTGDAQALANAEFLRKYVEKGQLGVKSSHGFYQYPNPSFDQSEG